MSPISAIPTLLLLVSGLCNASPVPDNSQEESINRPIVFDVSDFARGPPRRVEQPTLSAAPAAAPVAADSPLDAPPRGTASSPAFQSAPQADPAINAVDTPSQSELCSWAIINCCDAPTVSRRNSCFRGSGCSGAWFAAHVVCSIDFQVEALNFVGNLGV